MTRNNIILFVCLIKKDQTKLLLNCQINPLNRVIPRVSERLGYVIFSKIIIRFFFYTHHTDRYHFGGLTFQTHNGRVWAKGPFSKQTPDAW